MAVPTRVGLTLTVAALLVWWLVPDAPRPALAAELQARSAKAYDEYLDRTTRAFVSRTPDVSRAGRERDGVLSAGPAGEDGIIKVPGGLVHHWVATAYVRRSVEELVAVSLAYPSYPAMYRDVISAEVLASDGNTHRLQMRVKGSGGGLSAVLQIRSTVHYTFPAAGRVDILSNADEIREVKNAGERDEQLLPAGNDSGYLWRANTFTRLLGTGDGVFVEMETLGLSRGFPPLLGWVIEPIARRIGRRSVEHTLDEFVAASLARTGS